MDEAAIFQREGYPLDVIKEFRSMEQYNICKEAGLSQQMVNGNTALIRDIDLDFVDEMGRTNLERMQQGLAALDPATGGSYQLHHVGQRADSTLAILTRVEHMIINQYQLMDSACKKDSKYYWENVLNDALNITADIEWTTVHPYENIRRHEYFRQWMMQIS